MYVLNQLCDKAIQELKPFCFISIDYHKIH